MSGNGGGGISNVRHPQAFSPAINSIPQSYMNGNNYPLNMQNRPQLTHRNNIFRPQGQPQPQQRLMGPLNFSSNTPNIPDLPPELRGPINPYSNNIRPLQVSKLYTIIVMLLYQI